jgi:hypothetical protein
LPRVHSCLVVVLVPIWSINSLLKPANLAVFAVGHVTYTDRENAL